jgi:hypothetical protein
MSDRLDKLLELAAAAPRWVNAAKLLRSMLLVGRRPDNERRVGVERYAYGAAAVRACNGFEAAVSHVLAKDREIVGAAWAQRRPRVLEVEAALDGDESTLARRPDLVSAIEALAQEESAAVVASMRKGNVIAAADLRVYGVLRRRREREAEIAAVTNSAAAGASSFDQRAAVWRGFQDRLQAVTEVVVSRINAETRRVLDLEDTTRLIAVKTWLEMQDTEVDE